MLALILRAVRTRTAQALTLLILAALAAAAAAAGPCYGLAAASGSAAADVSAAPAGQRVLSARQVSTTNGDPSGALKAFAGAVHAALPVSGGEPVLGLTQAMTVTRGTSDANIAVDYRDGFCAHVHLDGACPAARGETAISRTLALQLGIQAGGTIAVRVSPGTDPLLLKVVGRYDLVDPVGAYWSDTLFRSNEELDPVFTPITTFTQRQLGNPTLALDLDVPEALIRGDNGYDLAEVVRVADGKLSASGINLVNPTGAILNMIERDRSAIRLGVLVALGQVLVLALFAIGLAGSYTGRDRRGDAALLKLRGSTRSGMLRLTLGQHLVPLLGGVVVGAPLGFLTAWAMAGRLPVRSEVPLALQWSVAAAAVVLLGGLLVLAVVDSLVLRQPVVALLRRVPAGRRGWRSAVVDLVLVAVAVAAAYQARTAAASGGLALVAPALVALAVGLLLARLLGRIADRVGAIALRTGRLRLGLTAVQASRKPGTDRVFAFIVVAVAMFATAVGGFAATRTARVDRADVELGAARVLTVQATSRTALQSAVDTADSGGRFAMAVVIDQVSSPPVLAVDTYRMSAIATWRPEYGDVETLPKATDKARPPAQPPLITGAKLIATLRNEQSAPLQATAVLQNENTGAALKVVFGPIPRGEHTLTAKVPGCAAVVGCRFIRWQLQAAKGPGGRPATLPAKAQLTVLSLNQEAPSAAILDFARLTDIARWRSGVAGAALDVSTDHDGLTLTLDPNAEHFVEAGTEVYSIDAPLPLPVVLAGPAPQAWKVGDPTLLSFGNGATPVRVVGTAKVLPVVGASGVMVDFNDSRRISADADARGTFQVWLARDTPASIVRTLQLTGLTIVGDRSAGDRQAQLAQQGPAVASRFMLLVAVIGLLLAAAALAVTVAVDREAVAEQMEALRLQGLSAATAVKIAWTGLAGLVAIGLVGGLVAAAVADVVARVTIPGFTDGWRVIEPPSALGARALVEAGVFALIVLGLTARLAVRPLIRRVRGDGP